MHGIRDVNVAGAFLLAKVGEMKDNTTKADQSEVYENRILEYADEYIQNLDAPSDDDRIQLMHKPPVFRGMLKYIYINTFKPNNNLMCNKHSIIDYNNIDQIMNIWSLYVGLCYKYQSNPTILNFEIFTGISDDVITSWGRDKAGSSKNAAYKSIRKECEAAAYDVAMSGNPGGMFVLKACYGYTEQPQQIVITQSDQGKTPEQIAAEHMHDLLPDKGDDNNTPPAADF